MVTSHVHFETESLCPAIELMDKNREKIITITPKPVKKTFLKVVSS
jgi:hypothetical protein